MTETSAGRKPENFITQLRRMNVGIKLIILFVLLIVGSPFIFGVFRLAWLGLGPLGILFAFGGALALTGWFLSSPSDQESAGGSAPNVDPASGWQPAGSDELTRYCTVCAAGFPFGFDSCPECHTRWVQPRGPDTPGFLASVLNDLTTMRISGRINEEHFLAMREAYEIRVDALPPRPAPAPAPAPRPAAAPHPPRPVAAAAAPVVPATPVHVAPTPPATPVHVAPPPPVERHIPPPPPREPRPSAADMGRTVIGWAAERQADILLYVGAFLLSVSAIIFVAYQGETMNGAIRFAILSVYAFGFLGFGLLLHRWERVREAGPVFLALGAILVPFDFIALRTQVLSEDELPLDALWLLGSGASATLYTLLSARGYGRLYIIPAIPGWLAAWGSLGSVLGLPIEALGAWFSVSAAAIYVVSLWLQPRIPLMRWVRPLGIVIGIASFAWSQGHVAAENVADGVLPLTLAFLTAGLGAGLVFRRDAWVLAILPLMGAATAGTTWWAAADLPIEWRPLFLTLAGAGYLVVAYFDRVAKPSQWATGTIAATALAVVATHAFVLEDSADRAALPAAWLAAFALASASYGTWRWAASAAVMPVAGAMTLLTGAWASSGTGVEWYGVFAATAASGYLVLAHFGAAGQRESWRSAAAACAVLAVATPHLAVLVSNDAEHAALPVTYAYVLAGAAASFVRWRWEWRMAPASIPALAGLTAATTAWAGTDLQPEWYGSLAVLTAAGYLVIGHFDRADFAERYGMAALALGSAGVAFSHIVGLAPAAYSDVTAFGQPQKEALPVAYLLALLTAAAAFVRWRWEWRTAAALLPALAGMTAATTAWAAWDLQPEWYGSLAVLTSAGYLAVGHFDRADFAERYGMAALALGSAGVALAHIVGLAPAAYRDVTAFTEPQKEALPVAYLLALLTAAAAFVRWRWEWRTAAALLPALAGMTAATTPWAAWDLQPEWYGSLAVLTAAGYLAIGHFDRADFAERYGMAALALGSAGVALAHIAGLATIDYRDITAFTEPQKEALPVAYILAFLTAAAAYGRWRWMAAAGLLPPVGALAALTSWWAADGLGVEWYGCFAAAAALGYLALAFFEPAERVPAWRIAAMATGAMAMALSHSVIALETAATPAALPATDAIIFAGTAVGAIRWRFAWRPAPGALPALAAGFVITSAWAANDLQPEWWGPIIAAAGFGYLLVAHFDTPAWTRSWLPFSVAAILAGTILTQTTMVDTGAERASLPLAYGVATLVLATAVARWRFAFREAIALLPAFAVASGSAAGWTFWEMDLQWLTAWAALASMSYLIPGMLDREQGLMWRGGAGIGGTLSLLAAHSTAASPETVQWNLPVTYAVVLAGASWDAARVRQGSLLAPPILAALFGASTLWAADVGPVWWAYPALAVAAVMMATATWWSRNAVLGHSGWAYAAAMATVPTLLILPITYEQPWHGVAAQVVSAVLVGYAAVRANGAIVNLFAPNATPVQRVAERAIMLQSAFAFLLGAGASLNGALGIQEADRAWAPAVLGAAAWLLVAGLGRRTRWYWTFTPAALAGSTIAATVAAPSDATLAAVLGLATVGSLIAWAGSRRWTLLGIANSFLFLTAWAYWEWQGLDMAWLPMAYAVLGLAEWLGLLQLRRYTVTPKEADYVITYLSWGPWLLSAVISGLLLGNERDQLLPGETLVRTEEWALAAAVLGMAAAAIMGEGFRLRQRWVWLAGSALLLTSLLMAIATREPTNVQAYWAPIGAYLVVTMLTFRSSPDLFGKNMHLHEGVMLVGVLCLVLPPAEQSFEPGGGKFGLELLGISLAVLLVGLVLHGRWLIPAAVVTLTAVSVRMVTGGMFEVPYWLLFGLAGTLLLAFGFLVLLERERWDRFRHHVVEWWSEASLPGGPLGPPTSTPL